MAKFNVGDKVRINGDNRVFTVERYSAAQGTPKLKMLDDRYGRYLESSLTLVKPEQTQKFQEGQVLVMNQAVDNLKKGQTVTFRRYSVSRPHLAYLSGRGLVPASALSLPTQAGQDTAVAPAKAQSKFAKLLVEVERLLSQNDTEGGDMTLKLTTYNGSDVTLTAETSREFEIDA